MGTIEGQKQDETKLEGVWLHLHLRKAFGKPCENQPYNTMPVPGAVLLPGKAERSHQHFL